MREFLKKISVVMVVLAAFLVVDNVSALTEEEMSDYSQNNIVFYEPCGDTKTEICGTNQNYAGEQVWTDEQMRALEANAPYYQKAAESYGFPWQIIAVIHMREHGLARSNPDNGQGVYQFRSAARRAACAGGVFTPGAISEEQFQIQTNCVAKFIKEDYGAGLDLNTDDGVKKLFFKYNGMADVYVEQALNLGFSQKEAENGEGSPYVMNRYDEKREPSETWGQIKEDEGPIEYPANEDFGAFVYYKAISCGNESSSGADGSEPCNAEVEGSKNINGAAVALAWPLGTNRSKYAWGSGTGTELFNEVYPKLIPKGSRSQYGGCKGPVYGASCDRFVSTVVRYSGYDKHFATGVGGWDYENSQLNWANNHKNLWEVIKWNGDPSKLKAGDVVTRSGHIAIAVQDEDGKFYIAEAGLCSSYGHIRKIKSRENFDYILRATKANNSTAGISVKDGVKTSSTTGTLSNGTGINNGDIGATAKYFAWPEGTPKSKYTSGRIPETKDAWIQMLNNQGKKAPYSDLQMGACCTCFVWGVLKYAGLGDDLGGLKQNMYTEFENSSNWEKVGTNVPYSDLQDGDVLVHMYNCGYYPCHYAIFTRDESGAGHIVEASVSAHSYGVVKGSVSDSKRVGSDSRPVVVWRNKNNKSGGNDCNVCEGSDNNVSLKDGGLSLEDAKALMAIYKGYAGENNLNGNTAVAKKYYINVGCHGNLFLNCPSFVRYFVNRYTTKKWTAGATGNGKDVSKKLASDLGLQTGSKPQPYAVFSDDSYFPGHTGVVLAVNSAKGTMLVGQAGCMDSYTKRQAYDYIGVEELPITKYHLYTYLAPIINTGGL